MSKTHHLKIATEYYFAHKSGLKTYELRINDRDYQVGDYVELCEVDKDYVLTGRKVERKEIVYITKGGEYGLDKHHVILQLKFDLSTKIHKAMAEENCTDCSKSFSMLSLNGVPKERAKSVANGIEVLTTRLRRGVGDYKVMYEELIMAVGNMHEGETRHQTALRYIVQAETNNEPAQEEKH